MNQQTGRSSRQSDWFVTFYNVEDDIYEKANQPVADVGSSEGDDDNQDENRTRMENPMFDRDSGIDLDSPFLQSVVSGTRISPTPEPITTSGATAGPMHS